MFYSELANCENRLGEAAHTSISSRLKCGFEFTQEPEQVLVGMTAPAQGVEPEYDGFSQKVQNWEGLRSMNSMGLRSVVLVKNGAATGEKSLAQGMR